MVSSSAEAETGGTFENEENLIHLQHILETLYLHQKPTKGPPINTDNLTSQGIHNHFIKSCKSKTWDMRYHWLEEHIFQKQILLICKLGIYNWDDYFSKNHPPA